MRDVNRGYVYVFFNIVCAKVNSIFQIVWFYSITMRQIAQHIQLFVKNATKMEFPEQR